jgi:fucose permease
MLLFLFFGISLSTLDMTGNAIVPDVQQEKSSSALSVMHGIASIGAVAAPLIAGGITEAGLPWQSVYTAVGFFMLFLLAVYVLASLYARSSLKTIKAVHLKSRQKGEARKFITDKKVWAAIFSTLMFGGFQSGIVVWVAQYFKEALGSGQLAAGLGLTAYWLGTGIIRLLFGITPLRKLKTRPVNICGCIASGVVLAAGMLTRNYGVMLACVFVSGALNAPMLPRTMGLVSSWYRRSSGLASSAVFSALYLAYAFFPLLMGSLAYAWGMHMLILAPAACTVLSGVIALLLPRESAGLALAK